MKEATERADYDAKPRAAGRRPPMTGGPHLPVTRRDTVMEADASRARRPVRDLSRPAVASAHGQSQPAGARRPPRRRGAGEGGAEHPAPAAGDRGRPRRHRPPPSEVSALPRRRRRSAARPWITGFHPAPEPLDPLRRRSMGEAIGHHPPRAHLLQPVVANRRRRAQRFFDVAGIELHLAGRGAPDRAASCPQTPAKQSAWSSSATEALLAPDRRSSEARCVQAEQRLHVMTELVRDDIGLARSRQGAEASIELAEEPEIQVYLPVLRAVERAGRRLRKTRTPIPPRHGTRRRRCADSGSQAFRPTRPGCLLRRRRQSRPSFPRPAKSGPRPTCRRSAMATYRCRGNWNRLVPLSQLRTRTTRKPPSPRGMARPPPDRPRMSSISPRVARCPLHDPTSEQEPSHCTSGQRRGTADYILPRDAPGRHFYGPSDPFPDDRRTHAEASRGRGQPVHRRAALLSPLRWRSIGPANTGGRIDDFAVARGARPARRDLRRDGQRRRVQEHQPGHVVDADLRSRRRDDVDRRHRRRAVEPDVIVWVGTGEANNRQSSSWGDGVYRSIDAGQTWTSAGLADTRHIGRIVVHPSNPDVVYVAAAGHLWGSNSERGVFKTSDGGRTLDARCCHVDDDTGATDLVMDPQDPQTLFAAMYQRQRKAWGFNGGGPGSGIFRSRDGGATWTQAVERAAGRRQGTHRPRHLPRRSARDLRRRRGGRAGERRVSQRGPRRHVAGLVHAQPAADVLTARSAPTRTIAHASICSDRTAASTSPTTAARRSADVVQHRPLRGSRALDRSRRHQPPDRRRRRRRLDLVGPRHRRGCSATTCRSASSTRSAPTCRTRTRSAAGCRTTGTGACRARRATAPASRTATASTSAAATAFTRGIDPTDARTAIIESQDGRANRVNLSTLERQADSLRCAPRRHRRRALANGSAGTGTRRS